MDAEPKLSKLKSLAENGIGIDITYLSINLIEKS